MKMNTVEHHSKEDPRTKERREKRECSFLLEQEERKRDLIGGLRMLMRMIAKVLHIECTLKTDLHRTRGMTTNTIDQQRRRTNGTIITHQRRHGHRSKFHSIHTNRELDPHPLLFSSLLFSSNKASFFSSVDQ